MHENTNNYKTKHTTTNTQNQQRKQNETQNTYNKYNQQIKKQKPPYINKAKNTKRNQN